MLSDDVKIAIDVLRKLGKDKKVCTRILLHKNYVDSQLSWTTTADHLAMAGSTIVREDLRNLCHFGFDDPRLSQGSKDFLTAIRIIAEQHLLEPLNLERFM